MQNLFYYCKIKGMETICSLQNAKVKVWTSLHKKRERDKTGLFLIEGEHLIQEALKENIVETIITDSASPFDFKNTVVVTPQIMHKISENVSAVHLIAVCHKFGKDIQKRKRILILDGVQDPGNVGTLIRTAVSFSFDVVYMSEDACDLYNDKTIRSTQGALFHIPVIRGSLVDIVHQLQEDGVYVVATSLEESMTMSEIGKKESMAFILGNEGQGVSRLLQDQADCRLRIEMHGFESLNVAVAGGIVMYQYRGK